MSATKILDHKNLNQLQQVKMRLRHVYFHRTLQYIPRGQLRMHIVSFYELLKISLALHTRPLHTLLELLLNIKEPRDLNYIES